MSNSAPGGAGLVRACAMLTVKSFDAEQRVIAGLATTPRPDRIGDVVEPLGIRTAASVPLLLYHDPTKPVGTVRFEKATADGLRFQAHLPAIAEPASLRDRIEEAWSSIRHKLVAGVSIGFRAVDGAVEQLKGGGLRFLETEVLELSLVTVPANADASIDTIKSLIARTAAPGRGDPPGASGAQQPFPKVRSMNIAEQIRSFENSRAAKAARLEELMAAAGQKSETLEADASEEYDGLEAEVKSIDVHLRRLRDLEKTKATTAKPVEPTASPERAAAARAPESEIVVKAPRKSPPGIDFARYVKCRTIARLDHENPRDIAKALYGEDSPVFILLTKAAVPAGTTSNATWAGALISEEGGPFADFVEFLRPQTILGKFGAGGIPGLRSVPFRRALIGQTSGGNAYWVGEGKPKPLTKFDFSRTTLEPLKVANIAVCTEEVLRDSSPSAEMLVRDSLAAAIRERLDIDFINPAKAAVAGVSPASITNGITPIASDGNDADSVRVDIKALLAGFIAANNPPTAGVWIMSATTALSLSLMLNPLGQAEFPGVTMAGGALFGMPVIVSEYVGNLTTPPTGDYVILVNASDIYLADEGGLRVDMSREASLQMDDAPATQDATTGTGTSLVSLWQTNTIGFLCERTINWARRRTAAVQLLSGVLWGEPVV